MTNGWYGEDVQSLGDGGHLTQEEVRAIVRERMARQIHVSAVVRNWAAAALMALVSVLIVASVVLGLVGWARHAPASGIPRDGEIGCSIDQADQQGRCPGDPDYGTGAS